MDRLRVFVSSILDARIEDLVTERSAIIVTIEDFGIFDVWAFERTPASSASLAASYLDRVRETDIFVLLVGSCLTGPVRAEYDAARAHARPMLVFVKRVTDRKPEVTEFLRGIDCKYAPFGALGDLVAQVRGALQEELLRRARTGATNGMRTRLESLIRSGEPIRITPIIPTLCAQHTFKVKAVDSDTVKLEKETSDQGLTIPLRGIKDLLVLGEHNPTIVVLSGRLQWLSATRTWQFFPEAPGPNQPFGFGRPSSSRDPRVYILQAALAQVRRTVSWVNADRLPEVLGRGYQIVYDDDGTYLHIEGIRGGQVLVADGP